MTISGTAIELQRNAHALLLQPPAYAAEDGALQLTPPCPPDHRTHDAIDREPRPVLCQLTYAPRTSRSRDRPQRPIVGGVRTLRLAPLGLTLLVTLGAAALLPFLSLALLKYPITDLPAGMLKLLFGV